METIRFAQGWIDCFIGAATHASALVLTCGSFRTQSILWSLMGSAAGGSDPSSKLPKDVCVKPERV